MLNIHNYYKSQSVWQRDAASTEVPANDEVRVDFSQSSLMCKRQEIVKMVAMEILLHPELSATEGKTLNLSKCDPQMFKMVTALVVEKKHIFEVMTIENIRPTFLEDLFKTMRLFHPKACESMIPEIKNQCAFLTPAEARKVLGDYNPADAGQEAPALVGYAKKILRHLVLFASDEEATQAVEKLKSFAMEEHRYTAAYDKLLQDQTQNLTTSASYNLIQSQLSIFREGSSKCKEEINRLSTRLTRDFTNLSMMEHQNIINRAGDLPEMAETVEASKKTLENYKKLVLDILTKSGAHMDRTDLLEYLVGPKAFLFNTYNMMYDPHAYDTKYPFSHANSRNHFGYQLENDGPMELEEEIRTDIKRNAYNVSLGDFVVKTREFTKPISEKVRQMREELLPILKNWASCSEEDRVKVKQTLIDYNDWCKYDIKPEHLTIYIEGAVTDTTTFEGKLTKFEAKYMLQFKATDFDMLLMRPDGRLCCDRYGVQTMLKEEFGSGRIGIQTTR